jgi:hypothetical protein
MRIVCPPERRADRSTQTEGNVVVQLSYKHEAFLCIKESLWASQMMGDTSSEGIRLREVIDHPL